MKDKQDELREKIAQLLSEMALKIMTGEGNSTNYTDQILALFPNEEEIRKDERDRIWNYGDIQ